MINVEENEEMEIQVIQPPSTKEALNGFNCFLNWFESQDVLIDDGSINASFLYKMKNVIDKKKIDEFS